MSTEIGKAYVLLMPSMSGFSNKVNKNFSSAGKSSGAAFNEGFDAGGGSVDGFTGKMAGLAGAVGGVASELAGRVVSSITGLAGEMMEASDSAQKFASTLSFAGIDDSTIKSLTKSTQEYADRTVYELADIRNATAQLAANGVDNYAQLAEAAGNLNAVAGGNADTFKSVSMVMSQTAGSGRLMTENWNQLTDAIPGASGALQDAMKAAGAFEGNFRDAMEKGEISADEFFASVQQLGMTDVAVEAATSTATMEGALGNLQASVVNVGSQALDAVKPFVTGFISGLAEIIAKIPEFITQYQGLITAVGGAVGVFGAFSVGKAAISGVTGTISKLKTAADVAGGSTSALGTLIGNIGAAKNVGGLKAIPTLFSGLISPVGLVVAGIAALAAAFLYLWNTNEGFRNGVMNLVNNLMSALMPVIEQVGATLQSLAQAVLPIITAAIQWIVPIIQQVVGIITQLVTMLMSILIPVINSIVSLIQAALPIIVGIISTSLNVIMTIWNAIWPVLQAVIQHVFNIIQTTIQTVLGVIQGIIQVVTGIISGDWGAVWEGIKTIVGSIWDGIINIISSGFDFLGNLFSSVLNMLKSLWDSAWNAITSFLSNAWNNITTAVSNGIKGVIEFFTNLPGNILSALGDLGTLLLDVGADLMAGLVDGILGGAAKVGESIMGAITGAVDAVKNFLGIASPSKLFRSFGQYTMQGLSIGVEREAPSAAKSMQSAMDSFYGTANKRTLTASMPSSAYGGSISRTDALLMEILNALPSMIRDNTPSEFTVGGRGFAQAVRKYS